MAAMAAGPERLIGPVLIACVVATPFSWFVPLFTARIPYLWREDVSVANGLAALWDIDLVLFAFVALFAILAPAVKALAMAWAWYAAATSQAASWLRRLALLQKLAMGEVFLLAVVLVGFKGVGLGRVEIRGGVYFLAALVLTSILAALAVDRSLRRLAREEA